jgi:hypothetical protein
MEQVNSIRKGSRWIDFWYRYLETHGESRKLHYCRPSGSSFLNVDISGKGPGRGLKIGMEQVNSIWKVSRWIDFQFWHLESHGESRNNGYYTAYRSFIIFKCTDL